jgi:hypothetical protein
MTNRYTARDMLTLRDKIYKGEGWTRVAGESHAVRVNREFEVKFDFKRNIMIATRREKVTA